MHLFAHVPTPTPSHRVSKCPQNVPTSTPQRPPTVPHGAPETPTFQGLKLKTRLRPNGMLAYKTKRSGGLGETEIWDLFFAISRSALAAGPGRLAARPAIPTHKVTIPTHKVTNEGKRKRAK
eukprot:3777714-Rhodomonas_salina.2